MVQCGSERWRNLYLKPVPDAGWPPRLDKLRPLIGEIVGIFNGRVPRGSTLTTPGAAESVNAARLPRAYFRDRRFTGGIDQRPCVRPVLSAGPMYEWRVLRTE